MPSKISTRQRPISAEDFALLVQKKLTKKPKNSIEIARQLGYVDDAGNVRAYGAAKVRRALQALAEAKLAVHEGAYRTSVYRLPD